MTTRTKHVFPTGEIAHLWAHQTQNDARNAQSNLFFEGKTIYSYRTSYPIGRLVTSPHKAKNRRQQAVLLQVGTYSVTTSMHCSLVRRAVNHLISFTVPCISWYDGDKGAHQINLKWYQDKIDKLDGEMRRSKIRTERIKGELDSLVSEANHYAQFFMIRRKFKSSVTSEEYVKLCEGLEGRREQVERASQARYDAKRARWEARDAEWKARYQAEQDAIAARNEKYSKLSDAALEQILQSWSDGVELDGFSYASEKLDRTVLQFSSDGSEIVTSQGARFPVSHARLGLVLVRRVVASGQDWHTNGHTCHLGHYKIDKITADGTVYAGCHVVKLIEIERIADRLEGSKAD